MPNELFPKDGFKLTIPIFKAYEEDGDVYIMGLGGDTEPDDQDERLTSECIEDMKRQVQEGHIPLIQAHWNAAGQVITTGEWFDELGQVVDIIVTPQGQLFPKILMDMDMETSRSLVKKIHRGKKLGLSYGGKPEQWHIEFTPDGKTVKVFDRIKLWHFVPTTRPVYSRNLNRPLEIVAKSVTSDEWERAARIAVDSIDFHDYERREEVVAIYKSFKEEVGNSNAGDKLAGPGFESHVADTESGLSDSDFAWTSFAYQKMSSSEREKANKGEHRKLPYSVKGESSEAGWRAAWNAVHVSRGGLDFSGGPRRETVIRKLLASKPKGIEVTKSKDDENVFCVEGVTLSAVENVEEIEILKAVHPDIFKSKSGGKNSMELKDVKEVMELILPSMLDKAVDIKLKSFKDEQDKGFAALTKSLGDISEALKSKKDVSADGAALKSEDVSKIVLDTLKDKMGEMAQAALKSRQDGEKPGETKKEPVEQFREDVVALCKGEKSFEDFKDEKYVAKLKSQMEAVSAEVFHNMAGTDPSKVEAVYK